MDNLAFESVAGRGGSGVVWLATHRDGTKLAVKLLHTPARTVAGLVHRGIVVVSDYGVLPANVPPALEASGPARPGSRWSASARAWPSSPRPCRTASGSRSSPRCSTPSPTPTPAGWHHPAFVEAARLLPAGRDRDRLTAIARAIDEQLRTNGVLGVLPE